MDEFIHQPQVYLQATCTPSTPPCPPSKTTTAPTLLSVHSEYFFNHEKYVLSKPLIICYFISKFSKNLRNVVIFLSNILDLIKIK